MGYRLLSLPVFGAFALSMTLAGPALAQDQWRAPYGGWSAGGYVDYAYDNGYRAGSREGEKDARNGRAYGFKRDDAYEDADWGFRGGDKGAYRHEFRRGYEAGYDTTYRRFARGGWYDNRPTYEVRPAYPPYGYNGAPVYGGNPYARVAYDNGYRDGLDEGRKARRKDRAFEPYRCDRYEDGDHGYDRRYGPKDAYKVDFRVGFVAGYRAGYGDPRGW